MYHHRKSILITSYFVYQSSYSTFLNRNVYPNIDTFQFLLFKSCSLPSPTSSFYSPISCTYFSYGLREPQSQSIWQTHLNFQEYVTNNIIFWYISNKIVFYLLLYVCPHKFLSSTMLNIKKLCLFNLNRNRQNRQKVWT